jgi:hypothetical protein
MSVSIDGSGKLTGVDQGLNIVGLTTITNSLHVTGGSVGVGLNNPAEKFDILNGTVRLSRTNTYTAHTNISITHESSSNYGSLYLDTSLDTAGFLFRTGGTTERLRITGLGGHRIKCNESWTAANLSECNTEKLAFNINQTRQGQTKAIGFGAIGANASNTSIQAYDTSDNSANNLALNPFGGTIIIGDSDTDNAHANADDLVIGNTSSNKRTGITLVSANDQDAGLYFSDGTSSGNANIQGQIVYDHSNNDLTFYTGAARELTILSDGTLWHSNGGNVWFGNNQSDTFSNAGVDNFNRIAVRAGSASSGTSPVPENTAIKIYPTNVRGGSTGTLSGGIAWQHLDPENGSWDTSYGDGAQMWMGAAIHDTPGQERDRFNLWMNSSTTGNTNPNNLAIEAYPNGMVRHPKVPAFMVRNSTNSGAFSAGAIATWDTEIFDNGNNFASNKFTAPIAGIYFFSCMMLSQAATRLFHEFRVNGVQVAGTRSEGHAVSGSYQTNTITMNYSLSANDYVEVYVGPNAGYGGIYTNFNGHLIG